jgi:[ribosomal protein S18]-alanine N-acetyltransferase
MRLADIDAVLAVEVRAYSHPWTRGNFIDSLAAGYVAELLEDGRGRVIAYLVAMHGHEETHLLNLSVRPSMQGRGIGRALLDTLIEAVRARGDRMLWLEVRPSNGVARQLYRSAGMVEVGLRRGYYPAAGGEREDALVMRLALGDANALD